MGVGSMVLGYLTVIDKGALGQVVFPVLGLEQKISGVGIASRLSNKLPLLICISNGNFLFITVLRIFSGKNGA